MAVFVVTAALVLFVFKIRRNALILSFLLFYFLELAYRAWLTRWHVPPETLFMGTLTSPAFYLFTFFMITDPATSPSSRRDQIVMALAIVLIDLWLHQYESLFTLFYAGLHLFNCREFFGKLKYPVAANLITFLILFAAAWYGAYALFDWLLQAEWGFLEFLRGVVKLAAPLVLTLVALFLLAPAVIEAVTGPFLDGLADATEKVMAGESIRAVDLGAWRNLLVGLRSTAQILVVQIGILLPCLFLALALPAVGFFMVYGIAAALTALIWFEIPFLRRGQGLRQRIRVPIGSSPTASSTCHRRSPKFLPKSPAC